jgi:ABC-type Fe3+ transport system substrate-binding protein
MAARLVVCSIVVGLLVVACAPSAAPPAAPAARPAAPAPSAPAASAPAPAAPAPAAAPSSAAAPGDTLAGLVEAARAEGQLNLIWTPSIGGRTGAIERWGEGFNRLYGLNVRFQYTPGPTIPEMLVRITQEWQSGRPAASDVYLGADDNFAEALRGGVLQPIDWAAWAPNVRDPALVAPQGVGVAFATRTPGITYNTEKVRPDEAPTALQDLLKPQFKGRVAASVFIGNNLERQSSPDLWGEQRAVEFATKYADQIGGLIRCAETERIATAEFDILAPDCGTFISRMWQARGAPLAGVIPTDMAVLAYLYFGVPVNAAHPAAAKLFVNYVLGREGQDILFDAEKLDHHRVPGAKTAPEIERLQAQGVKFTETDVAWSLRNDERAASGPKVDFDKIMGRQ